MPVFVENPSLFSRERLRSELAAHSVPLPPADSRKQVYVDLYVKHVARREVADFSSDEDEDREQQGDSEEASEQKKELELMDMSQLTDMELKAKLFQLGFKAGPIVASTRALYENKLQKLLKPQSQITLNCAGFDNQFSDNEDEDDDDSNGFGPVQTDSQVDNNEEQSGWGYSQRREAVVVLRDIIPKHDASSLLDGTLEKSPKTGPGAQSSPGLESRSLAGDDKGRVKDGRQPDDKGQRELVRQDKYTMTSTPLLSAAQLSSSKQQLKHPAGDILSEMFPGTARTPTGISATCRRPIKGAAGRPVKFRYPEVPCSPDTKEHRELQRQQLPIWLQIVVFLLVAFLFYFIFSVVQDPTESSSDTLLDSLNHDGAAMPPSTTAEDPPLLSAQ